MRVAVLRREIKIVETDMEYCQTNVTHITLFTEVTKKTSCSCKQIRLSKSIYIMYTLQTNTTILHSKRLDIFHWQEK